MMCTLFLLSFGANAFGALSKEHVDFAKGPMELLLTKEERKQWSAISTDEQAQAFIDLFWARRDPSPATQANEFRDAINERVKVADFSYVAGKLRGASTDRGKVFVLLGAPTTLRRSGTAQTGVRAPKSTIMQPTGLDATSVQGRAPSERWIYEQLKSDLDLGQRIVEVAFSDQYASNVWKRERAQGTDYATLFDRIARSNVTQPDLTKVPTFSGPAPTTIPAITIPPSAAPSAGVTLKSAVLRDAVEVARAAKAPPTTLFLSYGEFITAEGESFVPVQLYVPKPAGLTAAAPMTFFGVVEKVEGGERVVEIEEPATLTPSGEGLFYARSLTIPAGNYVGTFGLASEGKVMSVVSGPMTVQALDGKAPGVSGLMLSTNVFALSQPQLATDPFAFGGIKVVPKGDLTFRPSDELWYFIEIRNPGIDTTTSQPKVSMTLAVTGKTNDGIVVNRKAPSELVAVQSLKGVAGHYALVGAMPPSTLKPGSYAINIQVKDEILDKSYDLKESFRVVE